MKAEIPILYDANVIPAGHRSPRWMTFRDSVTADVPEVSAAEAPVAVSGLRVINMDGSQLRWHDGRLWVADRPHELRTDLGSWSGSLFSGRPDSQSWKKLHDGRTINLPDIQGTPGDARKCLESRYEAALERVREYMSGLLMVDGLLHARIDAPVAALWDFGHARTFVSYYAGRPDFSEHDSFQRPTDFYALPRTDDMTAHAEAHYGGLGDVAWPVVKIPEAFDIPDEEWSLQASAALAVEILEDCLPCLDRDSGSLWFRIRDEMAEHGGDCDELYGMLRDLTGGPMLVTNQDSENLVDRVQRARRLAVKSCDRWDMRPLDLPRP